MERDTTAWPASEWRMTLVSASCTMRYAASWTTAGTSWPAVPSRTVTATPGAASGVCQILDLVELRRRPGAIGVTTAAKQADGTSQLPKRRSARYLGLVEGGTGHVGAGVEGSHCDAHLNVDGRHRVGHDVVHLPCDAEPLLLEAPPRRDLAIGLGTSRMTGVLLA